MTITNGSELLFLPLAHLPLHEKDEKASTIVSVLETSSASQESKLLIKTSISAVKAKTQMKLQQSTNSLALTEDEKESTKNVYFDLNDRKVALAKAKQNDNKSDEKKYNSYENDDYHKYKEDNRTTTVIHLSMPCNNSKHPTLLYPTKNFNAFVLSSSLHWLFFFCKKNQIGNMLNCFFQDFLPWFWLVL
ncbi:hypothetical protein RFI_31875 [Reticulomyxa filosa]|uniref:Uncharacterized protein n=1 Tax=Reticulomyxa filosa TaxID=46433 RepID=X6LVX8_RETFI|nr:hypothetical protein RFI_31875 [Reticulomyxa filosa]|eukprot:ETO05521.1 hypothetical protein RFI_31875 [Reticulomyxa filosa]